MSVGQGTIRFVLCADDFALSPAVNRGIVEALDARRLTATGVMTTSPFWPATAHDLVASRTHADIGLHLNLTLGPPLGAMPQFAPSGTLPSLRDVLRAIRRNNGLPEQEIRAEIVRQIDAFEGAMRGPPDFVDGHQHVQVLPGIRKWLLDELLRRRLGSVWLRDSADRFGRIAARRIQAPKALFVAWLARGFATTARAHGFALNEGFAGFSAFDPKRDYAQDFASYLVRPGRHHLVMCHPGHVDAELMARDRVTDTRQAELAFLLSTQFSDIVAAHDAQPARFADIKAVPDKMHGS